MNSSTLIFVFPGQGSQKKGMGEGLFERFPEITQAADAELGYSIQELCLRDPQDQLNRTEFTQPALFTVNALTSGKLREEKGRGPDFVAGHSLGEYNALHAAGVFDFRTGLRLVKKRGELMSRASGGGMAAVIGMTKARIHEVLDSAGFPGITIANINAPLQTVLTGPKDQILGIKAAFDRAGARMYMPLNVSGAFHSPFMEDARREFETFLAGFSFAAPQIPVISNVEAAPYPPEGIDGVLGRQITSPVRWVETVQYFLKLPSPTFEEAGPGTVLRGLIRQTTAAI